jgi:hypothetical protein
MAKQKNKQAISDYMAEIGSRGGKAARGLKKSRSSEQARAAVKKRWNMYRVRKMKEAEEARKKGVQE